MNSLFYKIRILRGIKPELETWANKPQINCSPDCNLPEFQWQSWQPHQITLLERPAELSKEATYMNTYKYACAGIHVYIQRFVRR